jgi:hypothetical protein
VRRQDAEFEGNTGQKQKAERIQDSSKVVIINTTTQVIRIGILLDDYVSIVLVPLISRIDFMEKPGGYRIFQIFRLFREREAVWEGVNTPQQGKASDHRHLLSSPLCVLPTDI